MTSFQYYKQPALYKMLFALVTQNSNAEALLESKRYHKDKYTGVFMAKLDLIL